MPATQMPLTEARDELGELANRVAYGHDRVVLTRHGRGVAAVVPLRDLEILEALEERLDLSDAYEALHAPDNEGARVPWETLKNEMGL